MDRINLITNNLEEVITSHDLSVLLNKGESLKHYIGFELSGKIHLGTGIVCMHKVRELQKAGVQTNIFLADWHTWINDKLGGNRETIRSVGVNYFKEGLKAAFKCVGGNPDTLRFTTGFELYEGNTKYWETVIEICKNTTLARMARSITIAGRKMGDKIDFAKLIYPAMQVADIFTQNINLCHSGMDQRKAHVIARQVALKLNTSPLKNKSGINIKPVALHGHLLLGLGKPPVWPITNLKAQEIRTELKMSKSNPKSCIFINDSPETIEQKVYEAFCPENEIDFNPVLDWAQHLVFSGQNSKLLVERSIQHGGDITYNSFRNLNDDFQLSKLHPLDIKRALVREITALLEPARTWFSVLKMQKLEATVEKLMLK